MCRSLELDLMKRTGRGYNAALPILLRISLHNKIEKSFVLISRERKKESLENPASVICVFLLLLLRSLGRHYSSTLRLMYFHFSTFTFFYVLLCYKQVAPNKPFNLNSLCSLVKFPLILYSSAQSVRKVASGWWRKLVLDPIRLKSES